MAPTPSIVQKIHRALVGLEAARGPILLAVSGGPDSVAMLAAVVWLRDRRRLDAPVEVVTVDHQLRPGSACDADYVVRLSRRLGLPCHRLAVAVGREGGPEAAARRARYRALSALARELDARAVATAHTLEDQAETVLLRLARGAGIRGLRGVLPRRGLFVRPMLEVSRAEVAAWLLSRRLRPRVDPTNASARFARNRVRAEVLPALARALGPSAMAGLARSAAAARDEDRLLDRLAARAGRDLFRATRESAREAPLDRLLQVPAALRPRVLRRAARGLGVRLTSAHLAALLAAIGAERPVKVSLPAGLECNVRYGRCCLTRRYRAPAPRPFERLIPGLGRHDFEEARVEVREVSGPGKARPAAIRVDPRELALPLRLRSRLPGDRFRPRGGGSKKLKSFLIDRKVPREARAALPLLADAAGRVLWVVGVAESDAAAAGEKARRALEIRVRVKPALRAESDAVKKRPIAPPRRASGEGAIS